MVDTHTADGIKVGIEQRRPGLPLICLETALPAKFDETIFEALGQKPERPVGLEGIERLPQRLHVIDPDVTALKTYIAENSPKLILHAPPPCSQKNHPSPNPASERTLP